MKTLIVTIQYVGCSIDYFALQQNGDVVNEIIILCAETTNLVLIFNIQLADFVLRFLVNESTIFIISWVISYLLQFQALNLIVLLLKWVMKVFYW